MITPIELKARAIHEAAHAVFMWRSAQTTYKCAVPFEEVLISTDIGDTPELLLGNGQVHRAYGTVISREAFCRPKVPWVRSLAACGEMPRAAQREWIKQSKARADETVCSFLAGPIAEQLFRDEDFYWRWEYEEELDGDVTKALAIVENELCRGWRQTRIHMDGAVEKVLSRLFEDRRYWSSIRSLADSLTQRLRLSYEEAVEVIESAWAISDESMARS
jgi:hypothetical protein